MRVERIRIDAFGRLGELDTGPEALGDLVVVYGPNEAGKTTLFHFLTTLLYGFSPATRDAHPYAPWSGAHPSGSAHIRLGDGRCWEVHRLLRSAPSGSLVREGVAEELKNRALPCVEHVPGMVFRQVYAITLSELAGLEGEGWARIQDRLIVALGASDLRSARTVAEELEQEAAQLWRPNKRGRQSIRERRDRLRELATLRREIAGADQTLRDRVRERERVQVELTNAREEREAHKLYVERSGKLLEVRDALGRVRALEDEARPAELATLPTQPRRRRAELAAQARTQQTRLDQVRRDAGAARQKYAGLPPVDTAVLDQADEVDRVAARVQAAGWMKARAGQLHQEVRELEDRMQTEAADLFTVPWERLALDRLRAFPIGELRELARALEQARTRLDAQRAAERELDRRVTEEAARTGGARGGATRYGAVLVVVGGILVFLGRTGDRLALLITGTLALGAGSVLLATGLRRPRPAAASTSSETEALQTEVDGAERALSDLLADLPCRDAPTRRTPSQLVQGFERLQQAIRQRRDREGELTDLRNQEAALAREVGALALRCGVKVPEDALAAAQVLASTSGEMRRRGATAERAAEELARLELQLERETETLAQLRADADALEQRLADLGEGDSEEGLRRYRASSEAAAGAARLRQDLVAQHPDLETLQARIRDAEADGEDWVVDDEALAKRHARVQGLSDRVETLVARAASLDAEIDQRSEGETLDRVDGEKEVLEDEVRQLERERDRRYVLARLIREADRRFREEHQPELVRRASDHLTTVTGGRYTRVLLADGPDQGKDDASFRVRGAGSSLPVPVAVPLSTATREQIYLALRLAAVDHLDREGERLPIFLDETLVNWDPSRRDRGLALLTRIAAERQVFVFTCHPEVAQRLGEQGSRVISLEPPR